MIEEERRQAYATAAEEMYALLQEQRLAERAAIDEALKIERARVEAERIETEKFAAEQAEIARIADEAADEARIEAAKIEWQIQ